MMAAFKIIFALRPWLIAGVFFGSILQLTVSCNQQAAGTRQVCVPMPDDTSALGRKKHFIPRADLEAYEKEFTGARDSVMARSGLFFPNSEAFNKTAILALLKDSACVGIRIYYGIKRSELSNEIRLLLVGVDAQGNDLFVASPSGAAQLANDAGDGGLGGFEYGQCSPPCQ